ncbi:MAG TPA: SpoIID/LytB domain-containing protein, partial [Synergistales bacterium]|nr:SpoIID/LytB domain-containing protein [Synergistales bacterium]
VINVLGIEDYLKGVLKMEVNPAWPLESLKAQAIIARTYALRNKNRHGSSGFDLCALNHCQVYRGVNAEDPILSKAVDLTRGIVLRYQGAYAATFYHADSGGHTADVSSVWGSSIPYLIGKPEPQKYQSPYSNWQVSMGLSEIQNILASRGVRVGNLTGIAVSSRDRAGRAVNLTLTGTGGQTTIKASQFRTMIGPDRVRSTFFTIGGNPPGDPLPMPTCAPGPANEESLLLSAKDEQMLIAFTQQGVFNTEELMDMLIKPQRRGFYLRKALEKQSGVGATAKAPSSTPSFVGGRVTFTGRGWGHGVGLSQWGAKSLAEAGWDCKRILRHYFPGTELSRTSN